ncbi:antibiotic biosynthesis monooxygenase [Glycomyces sp. YM15]|uniref:antibiotic biosynthesis monooxygenase n=1 Tax=Glycomyces sp. YM15 TaxID=2800446 RepID=UPI0019662015|nr:antibiotic biosynthesis monooxygenase [Glycomyces sp. YM15]
MAEQVLTEVSAVVAPEREADLLVAYREVAAGPFPDGLIRTELLSGGGGRWRIQTLWRDQAALEAMRAGPEPPTAPRLFREVGADPELVILDVRVRGTAQPD